MQAEKTNILTSTRSAKYFRLETLPELKQAHSFLYIGRNQDLIESLDFSFQKGYVAKDFYDACILMKGKGFNFTDVILIDIHFGINEIKDFVSELAYLGASGIPVICNEKQIMNKSIAFLAQDYIDDIVDLSAWHFDFNNKIKFLKKVKERHHQPQLQNLDTGNFLNTTINYIAKRLFDIIIALGILVLVLPLMLIIAIAIKFESKGPVFYKSKRAGTGFRIFNFYKFRTMEVNADKKMDLLEQLNQYEIAGNGPKFFKVVNDPRITRIGKFLRNSSLDELPQLFNVIKGDMSLVGNRPLPLYEAATLTTNEFVERFMAPAGITGLWQIKKRGKTEMSTEERIQLDISYARNSNLFYDLWIMANTPGALFQKNNV